MVRMTHQGKMRVIDVPVPGGPEALTLVSRPVPSAQRGDVLIKVEAAGVNRADLKQRAGDYPMPSDAPTVPGLEVAGTVLATGAEVDEFDVGDRVCALLIGGGYAEYVVAPAVQCLPIPESLSFVEAAGLPETVFTTWAALFEQAGLQPGETVLIHGGASGIGTTAIQLAAAFGAKPLATAGTAEKVALCKDIGAVLAINYRQDDFVERVLEFTAGHGVDVVLDMVGGSYSQRNLESLALHGRICFIAGDEAPEAVFNIRQIMLKRAVITGTTLRHRTPKEKGRLRSIIKERVWPLISQGSFKPVIGAEFPMASVADAHAALESGRHAGKIVLRI
ncbi:NAD(P)H-quinone oxidoreductase [Nitratireductor pacificus]|uniref:Quinone oxidoreductase n=1 Tax=Nitratireductor pacificus pht-3B TaxID=391937 RepID=K2M821_9HYPH|nr:quinone oxidoreductase [Nitratireductor pacificus pht-3B]